MIFSVINFRGTSLRLWNCLNVSELNGLLSYIGSDNATIRGLSGKKIRENFCETD